MCACVRRIAPPHMLDSMADGDDAFTEENLACDDNAAADGNGNGEGAVVDGGSGAHAGVAHDGAGSNDGTKSGNGGTARLPGTEDAMLDAPFKRDTQDPKEGNTQLHRRGVVVRGFAGQSAAMLPQCAQAYCDFYTATSAKAVADAATLSHDLYVSRRCWQSGVKSDMPHRTGCGRGEMDDLWGFFQLSY